MEKILIIDGRQVKFKSTGAFLLRYKAQFHRDAIKDIYKMQDCVEKVKEKDEISGETIETVKLKDMDAFDMEIFYNLIWTLAKTADSTLAPPLEWLDTFGEFPLMEIIPEVEDMIFTSMGASVNSKKK
jgi:hypothetical protein